MRQGNQPQGQKRGRNRGNGGRRNAHRQSFDSNGPNVRIRGTAAQIYDKYVSLARDAASSGDRVLAESLLQHADHYFRLSAPVGEQGGQRRQGGDDRSGRNDQSDQDGDEDQTTSAEGESTPEPAKASSGRGRKKEREEPQSGPVLVDSETPRNPADLAADVAAAEDDGQTERVAAGD